MKTQSRLLTFTVVFCLVYATLYALQKPTLIYYPRLNEFHLTALAPRQGVFPVMLWYGWVLCSALGGLFGALIIPSRWASKLWLVACATPAALMLYVLYHEYHWFVK